MGSRKPSLAIYEYDDKWNLVHYQLHHIDGLNYAHDFLLLRDYYVFHMTPFADMTLTAALKVFTGLSSPGELMKYHSHLPSRFVVIPRHKKSPYQEVKLLDTEPFHVSCKCLYSAEYIFDLVHSHYSYQQYKCTLISDLLELKPHHSTSPLRPGIEANH